MQIDEGFLLLVGLNFARNSAQVTIQFKIAYDKYSN